ncbi:MAG: flagellar basal body rod protein FlgB [Oscillospiraceae bacterium]
MWDKLFQVTDSLQKGLDATWLRNEVISNNIANADTPGFKVSEVRFEDILVSAIRTGDLELKTTRQKHISKPADGMSIPDPEVARSEDYSMRADGNNVDIESQMTALAQNSLQYYTLVSKINSEFNKLNMAIRGKA